MIGRKRETDDLKRLYESGRAELVVLYGRRRVGKTYLINEVFKERFVFKHTGLSPADEENALSRQLRQFYLSLQLYGMRRSHTPANWQEAFFMLEQLLISKDNGDRQVVFFDELPWLDTKRSGFISAFEAFWNGWGSARSNLMVIVCGSASSWIKGRLLNNYGGLYNRTTYRIRLLPFSLRECEEYYANRHIEFSRYDIIQGYMIIGGIPYYMDYMRGDLSLAQNVDALFFSKTPLLEGEFDNLFRSIFTNPDQMKRIVMLLSTKGIGYTRKEIAQKLGVESGGNLSRDLEALISSDFVEKYVPFGESTRKERYRLIDPFCIFWLRFVRERLITENEFWQKNIDSQSVVVWRGIAFENICFSHADRIKAALGIQGVSASLSAWKNNQEKNEQGTQIDMIIDRQDNVINLCEIKFYSEDFAVDASYEKVIRHRQNLITDIVPKKKVVRNTLITTYGLKHNAYSGIFSNVVVMDALFRDE